MKKYRLALSKLELLRVQTTQQRSWFHLGFCKSSRGPVNKLSERVRYRCACYSQYVRVLRFFSTHCMFSWMTSNASWTQRSRKVASDWFSKNAWTCKLHTEVFQKKKRMVYWSFEYSFQISFNLVMVMLMWSCFKKEFPWLPQGRIFQISSCGVGRVERPSNSK